MATPASTPAEPSALAADAAAIRARLPPGTAAVFDAEWDFVLDEAKQTKDLTPVHDLLHKWRFFVVEESITPGWYAALQAKTERILRTGENPGAVSSDEMHALIARRRGE